jgi:hypothetical protein
VEEIRVDIREMELVRGVEEFWDLQLEGQFTGAHSDHGQWRGARPFYKREQDEPRAAIKLSLSS